MSFWRFFRSEPEGDLQIIDAISPRQPVLIAGPTACGKSSLALAIAEAQGGVIINADALQVFDCWQVLSARPGADDLARADHALYGHVDYRTRYSTGAWLRDLIPLLDGPRPIIVGGTGLNFKALTEGLAEIPLTPDTIKTQSAKTPIPVMLDALDAETRARIDTANPARVRRAWEVLETTGRPIWQWQDETPAPALTLDRSFPILLDAPKDWLTARIERRFDLMIAGGALDEVAAMQNDWDPDRPSAKAIGAPELMAHLHGELSMEEARTRAVIATRQYAKRQRTWFRKAMRDWNHVDADTL